MNAQDCLSMLRQMRDVAFATVDTNGHPQNRIIDVMLAEDEKLYFCTARGKHFYRELTANGNVAVTGLNQNWQMVRLTGTAVRLSDQKRWIDRIFAENPAMNDVYPSESRYILEPFCIAAGQTEFFDLGKSPIHREAFTFGGASAERKGFVIQSSCIGCGVCAAGCPQQCIAPGVPYRIQQAHCLHCGRCAETCPTGSIVRSESYAT